MSDEPEPARVKWWLAAAPPQRRQPARKPQAKPAAPAMEAAPQPVARSRPPDPPAVKSKPKPIVLKDLRLLGEALAVAQESDRPVNVTDAIIVQYLGVQGRKMREVRDLLGLDYSTLVEIMERNGWRRGWYLVAAYKGVKHGNGN